ncbi:sulfatase [Thalassotalea sp. PLHSN55]|uniref:sulfatase n=1 Tax=Thalassotalea sp. PLHSN55 TaxID=3435888 RepID=UPI003F878743
MTLNFIIALKNIVSPLIIRRIVMVIAFALHPPLFAQAVLTQPNVLFISIDDLRPEIGSYGSNIAVTPNIDKLASQGIQFNHAYAQQAICGPSRASVMTGLRPVTLGVTHNYVKFRAKIPEVVTIPQYFKEQGYQTTYVGKIFHHGDLDDEKSWSWLPKASWLPSSTAKPVRYANAGNAQIQQTHRKAMFAKYGQQARFGLGSGPAVEGEPVADHIYPDGYSTELAIAALARLTESNQQPFFLAFGMKKPHLPWIAPKKYWDLYQRDKIMLSQDTQAPQNGATMGLHASFELRTFFDIPKQGNISTEQAKQLKHAYLATVSYVDAQIGKLIAALAKENLLDNTIIVLWSDHGYHLGEKGIWGKATNYEIATRVPLIFWTPKLAKQYQQNAASVRSNALVELVDIFPTLTVLAGLETPQNLDGISLVPLFSQPERQLKTAAYSQFPTPALREWGAYPLRKGMRETYFGPLIEQVEDKIKSQVGQRWQRELFEQHLMAYAMRTKQYRLIAWQDTRDYNKAPMFVELYDHQNDPNETNNIAASERTIASLLLKQLKQQRYPNSHK